MKKRINNQIKCMASYAMCICLVVGLALTAFSCESPELISNEQSEVFRLKSTGTILTKKGAGMSTSTKNGVWWQNVNNLNSSWYYTWGTFIADDQAANAPKDSEFVPMLWSGSAANATNVAKLNTLYEQGKIKYVLGFNEPDLTEESNMTVAAALDKWEYLCNNLNPGIKLISPCTSYPSLKETGWMVQFMNGVQERNLRVDYIAVHIYQPNVASLFTNPIQAVYERWGKKIWLTEFGVRDESTGGVVANNRYTREQMLSFMQTLLPQLESMEAVDRYAWFNASPTMAGLWPCGLIGTDGSLTIVGDYYANFGVTESPNFEIGDGTIANPYQISRAAQFDNIRNYSDKNFVLTSDIDLSRLGSVWTPIPTFSGTIDGANHKVNNLVFTSIATKGGLITANTGNINNLSFPNVNIKATSAFGVLVGDHSVGTINNVVVKGTLSSSNTGDLLGGVAAEISSGTISNAYVNLSIDASCGMVGGIVGRAKTGASEISNCTSEGSITIKALKTRIGGIVGRGESAVAIKNCLSTMNINATVAGVNGVGGIFGANNNDNMSIDECMFTGKLTNVFMCGGIGGVAANIRNCVVEGTGTNLSSAMITVGGPINTSSAGGICGTGKGIIEKCVVRNAAFTGASTTALPFAGISSTFQNNGFVSKCVVSNILLNGVSGHGIAGTAGNGTGVNAENYAADIQYFENGVQSSYVPVDNKSGLDGSIKVAADLYERFFKSRDFDFNTIWKWEAGKAVLQNVGYKGTIGI